MLPIVRQLPCMLFRGCYFADSFRFFSVSASLLSFWGLLSHGYPSPPGGILGVKYLYSMGYGVVVSVKYRYYAGYA